MSNNRTLTGAGGAGKTRLGLQVAAGLAGRAEGGEWLADLALVGDPDMVAVTVADVLGVRLEPGRPVLAALVESVGGWRLLQPASPGNLPAAARRRVEHPGPVLRRNAVTTV
jgi:predicted ATPase